MKFLPIFAYNEATNIFTKALNPTNFRRLFANLGLLNIFHLKKNTIRIHFDTLNINICIHVRFTKRKKKKSFLTLILEKFTSTIGHVKL
jgi:hypothetical protein